MNKTFDELVWAAVQNLRNQTFVVDTAHAYGIISIRVAEFLDAISSLPKDSDQSILIPRLINIAACAQHIAETLMIIRQQDSTDDRCRIAEEKTQDAITLLKKVFHLIMSERRIGKSKQKGQETYYFEFGADFIDKLKNEIDRLGNK